MFRILLCALFLLICCVAHAQLNYVLNPDFELHSQCPNNNDQMNFANFWSAIDSTGNFNGCTPDYCHVCAPINNHVNSVPGSIYYWQQPHSGSGMAKFIIYNDESNPSYLLSRDYVQGRLYKKLDSANEYCITFYVNLLEVSRYAIKEISAYLDNGSIDTLHNCGKAQTQYSPQLTYPGAAISDTMNWTKIEGSFIASGHEYFITIGNFRDKGHTTALQLPANNYSNLEPYYAFYFIDDVSVIDKNLPADAGLNKQVVIGDSVYIGRPKEVGLECTWSILGNSAIIGSGAGIWVKPNVTTSYVVTQILCGNVKKDTVEVQVLPVGIKSATGHAQQYSLSPNPSSGLLQIMQADNDSKPVSLVIYEVSGKKVYNSRIVFDHGKSTQNISSLAEGIYYISLTESDGGTSMLHFIKQ